MNIIFCFDGTCNEPADVDDVFHNSSITNILKTHIFCGGDLHNQKHHIAQQKSFYYPGIGTYGNWFSQIINSMFAPEFADFQQIIDTALKDFSRTQDADKIYIFGFSRGAAIARSFANTLTQLGRRITFLGVYDTVASIGIPNLDSEQKPVCDIVFKDSCINLLIDKAVHCVALDERRIAFEPVLMTAAPNVTEVWFAGVHSDIGGGFWHDGLADICLDFMLTQAKATGLKTLSLEQINYIELSEQPLAIGSDDIAIHGQVDGPLHQKRRTSMLSSKTLCARIPRVECNTQCLPLIHHSVVSRFQQRADYRPISLRNMPFQVLLENGERSDLLFGIEGLRTV